MRYVMVSNIHTHCTRTSVRRVCSSIHFSWERERETEREQCSVSPLQNYLRKSCILENAANIILYVKQRMRWGWKLFFVDFFNWFVTRFLPICCGVRFYLSVAHVVYLPFLKLDIRRQKDELRKKINIAPGTKYLFSLKWEVSVPFWQVRY